MSVAVQFFARPSDELNGVYPRADIRSAAGYYKAVHDGLSGQELKGFVTLINDRDVFARVVGKSKSNLSKIYSVAKLNPIIADNVIDTVRVYMQAADIFGSLESGIEWLELANPALGGTIPSQLLDSHAGRELIRQTLRKIEFGEFS